MITSARCAAAPRLLHARQHVPHRAIEPVDHRARDDRVADVELLEPRNRGDRADVVVVEPVAAVPEIVELNIGHAIIARAVFDGLAASVREMRRLMVEARRGLPTRTN